jgi:flagellar FliJ protein
MPSFRFRLATLLRLREAARDERRARLAEAYRAAEILVARRHDAQAELEALLQRQRRQAVGAVSVDALLEVHRYQDVLRGQIAQLGVQQAAVDAEAERRRQLLVEADRDVRVLEQLRDQQSQRHRLAEAGREQKLLDEVGLRMAAGPEAD